MGSSSGGKQVLERLRIAIANRSRGCTPSEQTLVLLTNETFFSLWCYPNLFKQKGKELCDLVVVFDEHVLLFSDKRIAYKATVSVEVGWRRWYRRAVLDSVHQLFQAETWIRKYPGRIFLDGKCEEPFPLPLRDLKTVRFHRIAIANGCTEASKAHFGSDEGSLRIDSRLEGDAHLKTPFTVGRVYPDKPFVHVVDGSALALILAELDTIADFVAYFSEREKLFQSEGLRVRCTGEQQLLALYLEESQAFPQLRNKSIEKGHAIDVQITDERRLERRLRTSDKYLARRQANELGYVFDSFIETIIWRGESKIFDTELGVTVEGFEKALRIIAGEGRDMRRILGEAMCSLRAGKWEHPTARLVYIEQRPTNAYLFAVVPRRPDLSREEHDKLSRAWLYDYCLRVKLVAPKVSNVVGIHIGEQDGAESGSLCYVDVVKANEELAREFERERPILERVRTTKQVMHVDATFKEPGDFDKK